MYTGHCHCQFDTALTRLFLAEQKFCSHLDMSNEHLSTMTVLKQISCKNRNTLFTLQTLAIGQSLYVEQLYGNMSMKINFARGIAETLLIRVKYFLKNQLKRLNSKWRFMGSSY